MEFEKAELPELLRALDAELTQCEALKGAEASLKEQVEESRQQQEKVERKAMEVAKELMESSRAIVWLKSEVATQREQEHELEEMKLENERMRERLDETSEVQEDEDESKRASVVSEALQVAWEGEARAHRQAEQQLQNLQASLLPVRLQMLRLAELFKLRGHDLTAKFRERLTLEALQQLAQQAESYQRPSVSPAREPLVREPPRELREPVAREPLARREAVRPEPRGTAGPLYRLVPALEPSPARRRLDLDQEQRFDAYSVHRPRRR